MTYQEILNYLFTKLPMYQRVGSQAFKKDLTNTIKLCEGIGDPQNKFRSVHIAGTNGKGSTSHMIASVLQSAGYKTGLYTSPHLKDFTERIRIDGLPIAQQEVIDFTVKIKPWIESIDPSFFELTVAMAFDHFARHKVDVVVIETGLGGRFDSTNIIKPEISLITNISFDHQDMLGDTLSQIAYEKAGIIKAGIPVIVGERSPESDPVFIKKARESESDIYFAEDFYSISDHRNINDHLECRCRDLMTNEVFNVGTDLSGDYQVKNIPPVLKVLDVLKSKDFTIGQSHIREGLLKVRDQTGLKGRWQVLSRDPYIICDVGHNEEVIRWVVRQLKKLTVKKLHIVFGMVKDKKPDPILRLLPRDARYYFCQASIPRARDAAELAETAARFGLKGQVIPDVNKAMAAAISGYSSGDVIFAGGSTFVVGELNLLK